MSRKSKEVRKPAPSPKNVLPRPNLRAKLLLFVITLFVCFAISELGAWIWLYHIADAEEFSRIALYESVKEEHRMFSPHHYLNYSNTPNYRSRDGLNRHNSLGFRGDESEVPKPKGRFRIVALGGSGTYTIKVKDYKKSFTALMERELKEKYSYENVEVINGGVGGYNSWESLINLQFRVLDLEPDLLVIYDAINDVHARLVVPQTYSGDNSGERKQWSRPPLSLWERSVLLRIANNRLKIFSMRHIGLEAYVNADTSYMYLREDPMRVLEENKPIYFQRNLENMIAIARQHKIGIVLSTWAHSPLIGDYVSLPPYQKGVAENNEVIRKVAGEQNVPLFDFAAVMPTDKKYWHDGRHVNELGSQLKAELFAKFLDEQGLIPEKQ